MYELESFTPYKGELLKENEIVLAWDARTGYYFSQLDKVPTNHKIIAKEK
jgi:hypothetical protein